MFWFTQMIAPVERGDVFGWTNFIGKEIMGDI